MYGGNPNQKLNKPLQPHHIKQQLGTHNNRGIGGITPGKTAMQSPAQGANLNSMGGVPTAPAPAPGSFAAAAQQDMEKLFPNGWPGGHNISGAQQAFPGSYSPPPLGPRSPAGEGWIPPNNRPPLDPKGETTFGKSMFGVYGQRISHFDSMGSSYDAQRMAAQRAAFVARRRAKEMQLLSKRDEREAQTARPRSGTNWLYGF